MTDEDLEPTTDDYDPDDLSTHGEFCDCLFCIPGC